MAEGELARTKLSRYVTMSSFSHHPMIRIRTETTNVNNFFNSPEKNKIKYKDTMDATNYNN
jgi:hypothetical protein